MKRTLFQCGRWLLIFTLGISAAQAQWQTIPYNLKGGWNAIYLHGDATWGPIETVLPALNTATSPAQITSVWRWNPNPTQIQFTSSAYTPSYSYARQFTPIDRSNSPKD